MTSIPSTLIRRDDEQYATLVWDGTGTMPENYGYSRGQYVADTHYGFRTYGEDGRLVTGILPRATEEEAWQWIEENQWLLNTAQSATSQRDYWKAAYEQSQQQYEEQYAARDAIATASNYLIALIGDKAREYAIENSLCENYERFVSLVVEREARRISNESLLNYYGDNVHAEDSKLGSTYRNLAESMVRHMTRTRRMTVTVGTKQNGYGMNSDHLTLTGPVSDYYGYGEREVRTINREEILSFEDASKANAYAVRNGWMNGHRVFGEDATIPACGDPNCTNDGCQPDVG